MPVSNVTKEVDLLLVREQSCTNAMHRCVTPSLVVESAFLVQIVEELGVRLSAPEVEVADLEVRPDWQIDSVTFIRQTIPADLTVAFVVCLTPIVRNKAQSVVLRRKAGIFLQEVLDFFPESRDRRFILVKRDSEACEKSRNAKKMSLIVYFQSIYRT